MSGAMYINFGACKEADIKNNYSSDDNIQSFYVS